MWLLEFKSSFFLQVSGSIPIPPRYAFGIFYSRYWAYDDLGEMVCDCVLCCVIEGGDGGGGRPEFKFIINSVELNFVAWDTETH